MKRTSERNKRQALRKKLTPRVHARILLVEQDELVRNIVTSMLASADHERTEATDARSALALLKAGEKFDLILTNLVNDALGGIGLLEHTKEEFPDVPVVVMTTWPRHGYALEATRNGAYDYIVMPFEPDELSAIVHRALECRRLALENRGYEQKLGPLPIPLTDGPERILVQDDEEGMREVICAMLTRSGYECVAVEWPSEVLDRLSSGDKFHLLFCGLLESIDANLFELMKEQFPDIPVLVASACNEVSLFLPALRQGAYDYLRKPFLQEELLLRVRRALEYRRLKLENRAYSCL